LVVTPTGSGSKTGADWNNAYAGLPATLVRGDIYYLADGTYGQYSFSSASGTGWIEVRKAQTYDHCTNTGWNASTMGSSQARFTHSTTGMTPALNFAIDQVIVNGNGQYTGAGCGGGPSSATDVTQGPVNPADCGIKTDARTCTSTSTNGCDDTTLFTGSADNWKLLYMEWQGLGNAQQEQYPFNNRTGNNNSATRLIEHVFQHDFGANILYTVGHRQVDHSYFWGNQRIEYPSNHGQYSYDGFENPIVGITEFNNVYRDIQGTAIWGIEDGPQVASNIDLYDNVITSTYPTLSWVRLGIQNGSLCCLNGSTCSNIYYVNNTHANVYGLRPMPRYQDSGTTTSNVTVENNLWYNAINAGDQINTNGTQDHNSFLNSGSTICTSGTGNVCTQTAPNPFANMSALDFMLASENADWSNRVSLGSPYSTDAAGDAFSTDRGAYQFGSATTQVNPPTGLTAAVN